MKRLAPLVLAAALAAVAGDPPKEPRPPGDPKKEKLFSGVIAAGNASQAGAEIAVGWSWTLDADAMTVEDPIVADARGRFEKSMPFKDEKTFFAADKARRLGAGIEVKAKDLAKPVTIRLAPLVKVRGRAKCRDGAFSGEGLKFEIRLEGAGRIGTGTVKSDAFAILVPAGSYRLRFAGDGWQPRESAFTVPPGKPEFASPDVELVPSLLAAKMGQAMPEWRVADAQGLPKDAKMAGLRGKWLLMEFWRHGCPSCRAWGIPNLVKFHEKHASWRDRLQIVAFHNRDAATIAELESLLAAHGDAKWDVKSLPFPVVVDSQAASTVDEWGTGVFPYAVVLDPEGKLFAKGTLEEVEKRLEAELK
jgi:hypothetical protein